MSAERCAQCGAPWGEHVARPYNAPSCPRPDVANVEALVTRESAVTTPVEALWTAMHKLYPGTGPEDCWAILQALPAGWGLVDTRAVGTAGYQLLDALGESEPAFGITRGRMAGRHR